MKTGVLGAVVAALMVHSVHAQSSECYNTCGDSSYAHSWHAVAGVETLFLKPHLPNGEAFSISDAGLDVRNRGFDFDHELSPRVWLGIENCSGFGARTRYFYLDADTAETAIVDLGLTSAIQRQIADGLFLADLDAGGAVGDGMSVTTDLKMQTFDIEATQRIEMRRTTLNLAAGVRWADIVSGLHAVSFDNVGAVADDYRVRADFQGWGATVAAGLNRRLGTRGLALVGNARVSAILGSADLNANDPRIGPGGIFTMDDRSSGLFIAEVMLGLQYSRQLDCGAELSLRGTWEGQYWTGMPLATRMDDNFTDSDQIFLEGFGIGVGLNF